MQEPIKHPPIVLQEQVKPAPVKPETVVPSPIIPEPVRPPVASEPVVPEPVKPAPVIVTPAVPEPIKHPPTVVQEQVKPVRVISKGILNITTNPAGIEIFVDGEKRTEVSNTNLELIEGRHLIELYLPSTGYRYSFTSDISASTPVNKTFSLNGDLEVASFWLKDSVKTLGPKLDIFIDGNHIGNSQLLKENLLAGSHLIEVRYENVAKSRHVEIRPDSPLHINYSVIREAAPKNDNGIGNVVF